ncbi:MAG: DUF503 domain-containing protein [Sandaracinaceae bacterium]|nr:DUF503 domain-containing protein [Sandaracinaceae bacterium]
MIVATARLVLSLPGNDSLKGKRKVVRSVLDRARHKFNAALAEVDAMDEHRRVVLGAAVVSNDARHANAMIDAIIEFVATASEAVLVDRRMELVHLGELDDG